jgi:hypothetical protein
MKKWILALTLFAGLLIAASGCRVEGEVGEDTQARPVNLSY